MSLPAGTRLGVYEILAPIGAGGMGEVCRARDTSLGREVARKRITPDEHSYAYTYNRRRSELFLVTGIQ